MNHYNLSKHNDTVYILMATYNGQLYLEEQINSIIRQTHSNWKLIIRDDCSNDNTLYILRTFEISDPRISLILDYHGNVGCTQNFSKLLEIISPIATYIMFCDQDDIWKDNKIESSLSSMKMLEEEHGSEANLFIYGTYTLIDEKGKLLDEPSPNYSTPPKLNLLLSQGYVYGCTMMINSGLANCSASIPISAENHDYWISLVASMCNAKVIYVEEPLLFYRQHSQNVSGSYKDSSFFRRIKRFFGPQEKELIESRYKMFVSLKNHFLHLGIENKLLNEYIASFQRGRFATVSFCLKNNIRRRGLMQTLIFYFHLLKVKSV